MGGSLCPRAELADWRRALEVALPSMPISLVVLSDSQHRVTNERFAVERYYSYSCSMFGRAAQVASSALVTC